MKTEELVANLKAGIKTLRSKNPSAVHPLLNMDSAYLMELAIVYIERNADAAERAINFEKYRDRAVMECAQLRRENQELKDDGHYWKEETRVARDAADKNKASLEAGQGRLKEENDALTTANEECSEILAEHKAALAGLAGERLESCGDATGECSGHLGTRASKLFSEGLLAYERKDTVDVTAVGWEWYWREVNDRERRIEKLEEDNKNLKASCSFQISQAPNRQKTLNDLRMEIRELERQNRDQDDLYQRTLDQQCRIKELGGYLLAAERRGRELETKLKELREDLGLLSRGA